MQGSAFGLGVVLCVLLELFGGFVLVAMLPIVSMGGNGGFGEHFGAVILYFAGGAIPLFIGLKLSATSKANAVVAVVVATLAGSLGARALVNAVFWIRTRPDEWGYWACDSLFWAVDIAFAIIIWRQGFRVVRRVQSAAK